MRKHSFRRVVAMLLTIMMVIGLLPMNVMAAVEDGYLTEALPEYGLDAMPIISQKTSTLAEGITLHEYVSYSEGEGTSEEKERVEIYVTVTDLDVTTNKIYASYKDNQNQEFGAQKVTEQAAAFEENHPNEEVIVGINGSYYDMTSFEPHGALVMEGVEKNGSSNPDQYPFFAILKNGEPYIGKAGEYSAMKDQIQEAISGEYTMIDNGVPDYSFADYRESEAVGFYNDLKYPRQTIGITEDGKVITMTADGRLAPQTNGTVAEEQIAIMMGLGCVDAIQLDGGGSTVLCAKPEGEDEFRVYSTPNDPSGERAVSSALLITSSAAASDVFDHAVLEVENDYVTPGSTVAITVTGVSVTGHSADLPADIALEVDASMGEIVDNAYVAKAGFTGDAVIKATSGGEEVGSIVIHVVIPTEFSFKAAKATVKYGNTAQLELSASVKNGMQPVALKPADFSFTWSDATLGTIDGFTFTASEDTGLNAPSTLTATLVHNTLLTDTMTVQLTDLPDEPVVVEDFEKKTQYRVTRTNSNLNSLVIDQENGIVDKTTGKVHSGDYAFKLGFQTNTEFDQGKYRGRMEVGTTSARADSSDPLQDNFYIDGATFKETINLTNAQKLGFWLYVPDDSILAYPIIQFVSTAGGASVSHIVYPWGYNYAEVGQEGWQYFEADVNALGVNDGTYYVDYIGFRFCTRNQESTTEGTFQYEVGYHPNDHQSVNGYYEWYLDDITVEYLEFDIDRQDPTFNGISMSYGEKTNVAMNGQTITSNKVTFSTTASDDSNLDQESKIAYIDGVETNVSFKDDVLSTDELTLADGAHTVTFVISDEHGNENYVTRRVVVNAGSDIPTAMVTSNENNAGDKEILYNSLFWLDVTADDVENIETLEVVLNLNGTHTWLLDNMELAYGFTAEASFRKADNRATIKITGSDDVELTGNAVIASIPIRIWDKHHRAYDAVVANWFAPIDLKLDVDLGKVTYKDGAISTFSMEHMDLGTELYNWGNLMAAEDKTSATHLHSAAAIDDQAATCTTNGYTGRTFCEGCNSIVEFGTKVPATGHSYSKNEETGKMQCSNTGCTKLLTGEKDGKLYENGELVQGWVGKLFYMDGVKLTGIAAAEGVYYNFGEDGISQGKYTGLFQDAAVDNKYRYAELGVLKSGWYLIDEVWHYFDSNYNAAVGKVENIISGVTYEFEQTGKLKTGVWVTTSAGSRYYYGPDYYKASGANSFSHWRFATIDGKEYCFDIKGYRYEGLIYVQESTFDLTWYDCGTDGVVVKLSDKTQFVTHNGKIYYMENGVSTYKGLFQLNGDYYYVNSERQIVTGDKYIIKDNGLLPKTTYTFGADGKMIIKNGIVDGYWYVDNIKTYGGLMHLDTDGDGTADAYYYANSSGKIVTGEYSVVKNNDLMPQGTYTFDETGKMVLKNGIVDGYWYVNNIKTYGGLMHLDTDGDGVADAYYYANSSGKIATGEYYITKTNDLLPKATYNFGEDGKLICTKHVWDEGVVTTEPTYTQTGEKTLTCVICGETKTEAVPKLVCTEHAWDDGVVTTEPTATKEGEKTFTCANCGETKTEAIPATGEEIGAIVRIAGSARYDTAFAAANTLKETLGVEQFSTIIVASGEQFADALAGSYLAAEKDAPILLVRDNKDTMKSVKDYIKENLAPGGTVYLLGGKNAVPVAMESDLEGFTVTRLAGADRYATNLEILKEAGVEGKDILVCTGKDFADSLSASAVGLPILLVKDNLNDAQKEFLQGTTGKKIIIGGSNAVSYKIEDQLGAYGEVIRLAGVSRYDTSVLVAETFFSEPTQVVVAFAENFPDGLSGGPVANAIGAPLILTKPGKESAAAEYVSRTGINGGYVLGGTAVLPEKTVNKVFGIQ